MSREMSPNYTPRDQGFDAFLDHKKHSDNPYPRGTECHDEWNIGFRQADDFMFGNPSFFDMDERPDIYG